MEEAEGDMKTRVPARTTGELTAFASLTGGEMEDPRKQEAVGKEDD